MGTLRPLGQATSDPSRMGGVDPVATANEEAIEAWDGVLYDRFVKFRRIVTEGLAPHGDEALRVHPPDRRARP
jgi:hypothetical protein